MVCGKVEVQNELFQFRLALTKPSVNQKSSKPHFGKQLVCGVMVYRLVAIGEQCRWKGESVFANNSKLEPWSWGGGGGCGEHGLTKGCWKEAVMFFGGSAGEVVVVLYGKRVGILDCNGWEDVWGGAEVICKGEERLCKGEERRFCIVTVRKSCGVGLELLARGRGICGKTRVENTFEHLKEVV
ncbi:hypothetical protein RHMOL_Rhmol04G0072500 [Rhododendron molle]|uniref:Uncharacterized protein n=1 Tax=Rhododendron molle TaxID=49168 RepID=A0ACC0NZP2_RHOML|nr:hypothetical protein RHMOL_Rhmol04G0072500 [Rhododendron molle]